jgi:hypothetical protein
MNGPGAPGAVVCTVILSAAKSYSSTCRSELPRSSSGRQMLALRITTRRIRSSALDLPHHMATQVKPQATTVSAVFDFVFHLSASNRSFTRYTKVSGPVAACNLLGHHNRQHSLLYQPANAHPQIVVP